MGEKSCDRMKATDYRKGSHGIESNGTRCMQNKFFFQASLEPRLRHAHEK